MAVNNIMVRLLIIEITFLMLAVVNSYPAFGNNVYKHNKNRDKGRTIRGFKNMDLSTARGFGKRTDPYVMNLVPSDLHVYNKDESFNRNVPVDGSLEKILNNKYFARNMIENLIDVNHDGYISVEELLQPDDGES